MNKLISRKAGVTMLISDKASIKAKTITRDKKH